jgi:hypothetical protein
MSSTRPSIQNERHERTRRYQCRPAPRRARTNQAAVLAAIKES